MVQVVFKYIVLDDKKVYHLIYQTLQNTGSSVVGTTVSVVCIFIYFLYLRNAPVLFYHQWINKNASKEEYSNSEARYITYSIHLLWMVNN